MTEGKFRMTRDDALRTLDHLGPVTLAITDHVVCLEQRRQSGIVGQRWVRTTRENGDVDDVGNARRNFHRQVRRFRRSRLNSIDHNAARVAPSSTRTSTITLGASSRKSPVTTSPGSRACRSGLLLPGRSQSGCRQARSRSRWEFFVPANEHLRNCSACRRAAPSTRTGGLPSGALPRPFQTTAPTRINSGQSSHSHEGAKAETTAMTRSRIRPLRHPRRGSMM